MKPWRRCEIIPPFAHLLYYWLIEHRTNINQVRPIFGTIGFQGQSITQLLCSLLRLLMWWKEKERGYTLTQINRSSNIATYLGRACASIKVTARKIMAINWWLSLLYPVFPLYIFCSCFSILLGGGWEQMRSWGSCLTPLLKNIHPRGNTVTFHFFYFYILSKKCTWEQLQR